MMDQSDAQIERHILDIGADAALRQLEAIGGRLKGPPSIRISQMPPDARLNERLPRGLSPDDEVRCISFGERSYYGWTVFSAVVAAWKDLIK